MYYANGTTDQTPGGFGAETNIGAMNTTAASPGRSVVDYATGCHYVPNALHTPYCVLEQKGLIHAASQTVQKGWGPHYGVRSTLDSYVYAYDESE